MHPDRPLGNSRVRPAPPLRIGEWEAVLNPSRLGGDGILPLFGTVLVLGLVALCVGSALNFEPRIMHAIAIGCIPTGALGAVLSVFVVRWTAARRPDLLGKGPDERIRCINHRAGYASVHVLFGYFCLYTMLAPMGWLQGVSHTAFGSATMIFIAVVYWTAIAVYSRIS